MSEPEPPLVWVVWFTHSHCVADTCPMVFDTDECSKAYRADEWADAAAMIEQRITRRAQGCDLDAIVSRVTLAEWSEIDSGDAA